MNYQKTLFFQLIILSLYSYPSLSLEEDSDADTNHQKTISIIDIEACRKTADAISDDFARDYFDELAEFDSTGASSFFDEDDDLDEAMSNLAIANEKHAPTLEEQRAADEKKREVAEKECERQDKIKQDFIEYETDIYENVKKILSTYSDQLKIYKKHLKKMWPSQAILEITKDISLTPRSIDLLTLIEDYFEYTWQMEGYVDDQVGITASDRIFSYYLGEYNKQAALNSDPHTMDRHAHDLLQLSLKHFPRHSFIDLGDPEQTMTHINYAVSHQLFILNTWYIKNPKLVRSLFDIFSMQKIFNLGVKFLGCTTYGITNQYWDLAYMLKRSKFIGIKVTLLNDSSQYQHLWMHPYLPLQVRITENGKLTVGIVQNNIIHGNKIPVESIDVNNEICKISHPSFCQYVIPARFNTPQSQQLWLEELGISQRNELMHAAHIYILPGDMNFKKINSLVQQPDIGKIEKKKGKGKK